MPFLFENYCLDADRRELKRDSQLIATGPKVFDLLVYLIRHRDRVVTREELFKEVWDGREVSDATLSNHIKSARKVLGDSGELQKTILTIRGRGYQFIAPVTVIPEGAGSAGGDKVLEPQTEPNPAQAHTVAIASAPGRRRNHNSAARNNVAPMPVADSTSPIRMNIGTTTRMKLLESE